MALKTNVKDLKPARERFKRDITLLSKGYYAPKCFPNGLISVFPWDTSIDEWMMTQKRKAVVGSNLTFDVLPLICNLNGCDPNQFLASEALLILLVSRSILHNDKVHFASVCPHCGNQQQDFVCVPDDLGKKAEKPVDYPGWDEVTLENSKDVVRLRPFTIGDMRKMGEDEKNPLYKTVSVPDTVIQLTRCLLSVGGPENTPDDLIETLRWFQALHPGDSEQLLAFFSDMQPALDTSVVVECEEKRCRKTYNYELQLDTDFFRRSRLPGASR